MTSYALFMNRMSVMYFFHFRISWGTKTIASCYETAKKNISVTIFEANNHCMLAKEPEDSGYNKDCLKANWRCVRQEMHKLNKADREARL